MLAEKKKVLAKLIAKTLVFNVENIGLEPTTS